MFLVRFIVCFVHSVTVTPSLRYLPLNNDIVEHTKTREHFLNVVQIHFFIYRSSVAGDGTSEVTQT